MGQDADVIGVLELYNSDVCCLSPGPVASYVEGATIGAISKVDTRVAVWNLLKHYR